MNYFVSLLLSIAVVWARDPSGRVDLSNNCRSILTGIPPLSTEAAAMKGVITSMKRVNPDAVCLYASLDSIKTLATTTPEQRKDIADYCDGGNKWVPSVGDTALCFLYITEYRSSGLTPNGMTAFTKIGRSSKRVHQFDTKTENARACFETIRKKTVKLPIPKEDLVRKVQEEEASFEKLFFGNVQSAKVPVGVLMVVSRSQTLKPKPSTNENFEIELVFFSPNDSKHPLHKLSMAGLVGPTTLNEIVQRREVSLKRLLEHFGYQTIVVNAKLHPNVLDQIRKSVEETGASVFSQDSDSEFALLPRNMEEFIQERPETSKQLFPLVLKSQILVIGKAIESLPDAHRISAEVSEELLQVGIPPVELRKTSPAIELRKPSPAVELRKTSPAVELRKPSPAVELRKTSPAVELREPSPARKLRKTSLPVLPTGEYHGEVVDVVGQILAERGPRRIEVIVLDISDSWFLVKRPAKINGIGVLYPKTGYPQEFDKSTLYITNKKVRLNIENEITLQKHFGWASSKSNIVVLYDISVYRSKIHPFGKYLQKTGWLSHNIIIDKKPQITFLVRCCRNDRSHLFIGNAPIDDPIGTMELIQSSVAELFRAQGLKVEASYRALAEMMKNGGFEKVTFQKGLGPKDFYGAEKLVNELGKRQSIKQVGYDAKDLTAKDRDKTLFIHDGKLKTLNYYYHQVFKRIV